MLVATAVVSQAALAVELESLRMHEAPDYTRVVFDISAPVTYDVFTLDNPRRVVIDLANVRAGAGFDPSVVSIGRERVQDVRASARGSGYRVVLDVSMPVDPRGFTLEPVPPYGHRLVIDVYGGARVARKPALVPKPDGKRDVVIAVDPGHGGEDPGASGPGGIREKTVVMQIARRLAAKLNRDDGYRAVMVRDGDYYLAHRQRTKVAREVRADLFVSIHADAFKIPSVYGASVYTLSDKGASSETARWLAVKENSSDLIGGVGDVSLGDKGDLLRSVLLDLSMDANRSASIDLGSEIIASLRPVSKLHKKRVEQAGFLVLKSPDIPSVLVETGFISNPAEARRLNSSAHQEKVAVALYSGIRNYMEANAPTGTLIAWRREQGGREYTISRGDTLSAIAVRYGVSARRLKEANGLRNDKIRVGQVITIPAT